MSALPQEHTPEPQTRAEELALLAESARDFCARSLPRTRLRALRTAAPAFDRAHWRTMAELGWLGVAVPEALGGLDLGAGGALALCRALGAAAAPEPFVGSAITPGALLAAVAAGAGRAGSGELAAGLLAGDTLLAVALGPLAAEGTVFEHLQGRRDGATLRVEGRLEAVPLGPAADGFLVPLMLEGQPALGHVASSAPGIALETHALADGTCQADLILADCAATLLLQGEPARSALLAARCAGDLAASAYQLGLAETLYAVTRDYLCTRRQFGQAIGSFQALQHRLVDAYLALRLADCVVTECCLLADRGATGEERQVLASRALARSGAALLTLAREAIQLHGAIGYTDECEVGLLVNRALVVSARHGRPEAHIARCVRLRGRLAPPLETRDAGSASVANLEPPQGDWNALDNDTFREVVRQWHLQNYPEELKNLRFRARWDACREWYGRLYRRGFAAPGWPARHGGMGLTPDKLLIFIEEREKLGITRTPDQGIIMVGPLLMKHGSPEQQAYYLPRALSGEHLWCQGYSEPNAGSDLASLRTSAVRDGDHFVINGQKIWTTMAQDANQMFCLVRTDAHAKPQAGISFILIDFASPGITVRPIRNIAGDEEFCEVFFDNVRVPCANLVGELNDGWTIAKNLLGFERFFIGSPRASRNALNRAARVAEARGLAEDAVTRDRHMRLALDVAALEALYMSFADQIRRGEVPGADVSLLKIFASETFQQLTEFILDLGGETAAQTEGANGPEGRLDTLFPYYHARPTTIYGGSNEIQRNILAKAVLGLPSR